MSCWIVEPEDIDHIAALIARHFPNTTGMTNQERLTAIGRELIRHNNASYAYRYEHHNGLMGNDPDTYEWEAASFPIPEDPYFDLKILSCYDYQTCEHPEWGESVAHKAIEAVEEAIKDATGRPWMKMPPRRGDEAGCYDMPGWDAAPWGMGEYLGRIGQDPREIGLIPIRYEPMDDTGVLLSIAA
jgi:hypothetical protein